MAVVAVVAVVELGKKPHELTVEDVITLEADRARCLVEKMHEEWAKLFKEKMLETRREIDLLAPKQSLTPKRNIREILGSSDVAE